MRKTLLLKPSSVELSSVSLVDDGLRQLKGPEGNPYTVRLNREGEEINRNSVTLGVELYGNIEPPGEHHVYRIPPNGGYMPQSFSQPFEARFTRTQDAENFYGKTSFNTRRYNDMGFFSIYGSGKGKNLRGGRMFEFKGDLFFLSEALVWVGTQYMQMARLFKYDANLDSFVDTYTFSDLPIDSDESSTQTGSPDYFVADGFLHVAYRFINRDEGINSIVVFRANDDLSVWTQISSTPISDTWQTELLRFRLRAAYNDHSVMIVVYMVSSGLRNVTTIQKADMRSYVSMDGGFVFDTNFKSYRNVRYNDGGKIERVISSTNMAYMFMPEAVTGDTTSVSPMNEKFSLYYDQNMGSYVVMKAGDPISGDSRKYIMAAKTIENNMMEWEMCLSLKITDKLSGIPEESTSPWNPYQESVDHSVNDLIIHDLDIASGATINTMIVHATVEDDYTYLPSNPEVVFLVDFTFASSSDIPKSTQSMTVPIYAYGGKFHPEFSFVSSPWNPIATGLYTTGSLHPTVSYDTPLICNWRGQLVATARNRLGIGSYGYDENVFSSLTIFNPWQNYAEKYGYEFGLSARAFDISNLNYSLNKYSSSGAFTYVDYNYVNMEVTGSSGNCYLELSPSPTEPNIMEKASLSGPEFFKTRFTVKVNGLTASGTKTLTFLSAGTTADGINGYSLQLIAKDGGLMDVKTITGTSLGTVTGLDWTKTYEFIVGVCYNIDRAVRAWVLYRESSNLTGACEFSLGGSWGISKTALAAPTYNIGAVSSANITSGSVYLYDFQISSFGQGFRSLDTRKKKGYTQVMDAGGLVPATSTQVVNLDRPVKLYDTTVDLWDGSQIEIIGSPVQGVTQWQYQTSMSGNSTRNCLNGIAQSVYDFSLNYNKAITPAVPHCHCYLESFNTAEGISTEGCHIVFETTGKFKSNHYAMFNIHGVHCYDVVRGSYDSVLDAWTGAEVLSMNVPRISLDYDPVLTAVSPKTIVLNSTIHDFQDGQLERYSILIYNTSLGYYTGQLAVRSNSPVTISVDSAIPSLTDCELHLMIPYVFEELPATTEVGPFTHIGFRFYAEENAAYKNIGEIVIGNAIDISDYVVNISESSQGAQEIDTSGFDFSYSPRAASQPLATSVSIDAFEDDISDSVMRDAVMNCAKYQNVVLYNEQHDLVPLVKLGNFNAYSSSKSYENRQNITFLAQDFLGFFRSANFPAAPILKIISSTGTVGDVTDSFILGLDVITESTTLTYSWNLGDETALQTTSGVSYVYSAYGQYVVTVTVTDEWGQSSTASVTVSVARPENYEIEVSTPALPLAIGGSHIVTVNSVDITGAVATWNDTTKVKITRITPGIDFDLDSDGIWNEVPDDDEDQFFYLVDGEFTFRVTSLSGGSFTIQVEDQFGNITQKTITFA